MLPLLFAAALTANVRPLCTGNTTEQVNACLSGQLDQAQALQNRYLAVARRRLATLGAPTPSTTSADLLTGFDAAQAAWTTYRDKQCGNVFAQWSGGTIRAAKELECRIALTEARTHRVWRDYLTFVDSTPPILPEPPAGG